MGTTNVVVNTFVNIHCSGRFLRFLACVQKLNPQVKLIFHWSLKNSFEEAIELCGSQLLHMKLVIIV